MSARKGENSGQNSRRSRLVAWSLIFSLTMLVFPSEAFAQFMQTREIPAERLRVRLIQVQESEEGNGEQDRRLHDLLPMLRHNLRYGSYRLITQKNLRAQPGIRDTVGAGFVVLIEDVQGLVMTIRLFYVNPDRRSAPEVQLLHTRLRLHRERPVIIGPFRDHRGNSYIMAFNI